MRVPCLLLSLSTLVAAAQVAQAAPTPHFDRNAKPVRGDVPRLVPSPAPLGGGLAPTTWGFASHYSGSLYGTGYYPFKVDATFNGTNSMYGYTYSYPSFGFVNEIRAIYAFDVSSLAGDPPPVWSSFMFDTRERPPAGSDGVSSFAQIQLVSSGNTHTLQGSLLFIGNGAVNLDIYDAEDFENDTPFDSPQLAFVGNNPLITTATVQTDLIMPLNVDVSAAVIADIGAPPVPVTEIPALDVVGLATLGVLLAGLGTVMLRRRRVG